MCKRLLCCTQFPHLIHRASKRSPTWEGQMKMDPTTHCSPGHYSALCSHFSGLFLNMRVVFGQSLKALWSAWFPVAFTSLLPGHHLQPSPLKTVLPGGRDCVLSVSIPKLISCKGRDHQTHQLETLLSFFCLFLGPRPGRFLG